MLAVWWLAATVLSKGDGAFGRTEGQPTMLQDDAEAAVAPAAAQKDGRERRERCVDLSTDGGSFAATRLDGLPQPATMAHKFAVQVCVWQSSQQQQQQQDVGGSDGGLHGLVRVTRLSPPPTRDVDNSDGLADADCGIRSAAARASLSLSARYATLARSIGPDQFVAQLDGPELLPLAFRLVHGGGARARKNAGGCVYEAPFHASIRGDYAVSLHHVRERWRAVRELPERGGRAAAAAAWSRLKADGASMPSWVTEDPGSLGYAWPVLHGDDVLGGSIGGTSVAGGAVGVRLRWKGDGGAAAGGGGAAVSRVVVGGAHATPPQPLPPLATRVHAALVGRPPCDEGFTGSTGSSKATATTASDEPARGTAAAQGWEGWSHGRWVSRVRSDSMLFDDAAAAAASRAAAAILSPSKTWRVTPSAFAWEPYRCAPRRWVGSLEVRKCLAAGSEKGSGSSGRRHWSFVGDSHVRGVLNALLERACGDDSTGGVHAKKVPKLDVDDGATLVAQCFDVDDDGCRVSDTRSSDGAGGTAAQAAAAASASATGVAGTGARVCFTPDPMGERIIALLESLVENGVAAAERAPAPATAVTASRPTLVVNTGQHWASGRHMSLQSYTEHVNAIAAAAARARADGGGAAVVWLGTFANTITADPGVKMYKDWRTHPRLRLFNDAANEAMRANKVPVLETFGLSVPMASAPPVDTGHFSRGVYATPALALLELLGCNA